MVIINILIIIPPKKALINAAPRSNGSMKRVGASTVGHQCALIVEWRVSSSLVKTSVKIKPTVMSSWAC
eukprot:2355034-Lingulodinium_polyedra.AAC.1